MLDRIETQLVPLLGSSLSYFYGRLFKLGDFGFDHDGSMQMRSKKQLAGSGPILTRKLPGMSYWPCAITSNILIRISRARIECWGHRGVRPCLLCLSAPIFPGAYGRVTHQASAAFPENTLASFEAAIRDGSEGIESGRCSCSSSFSS